MLKSVFTVARGAVMALLLVINTVFWATPVYVLIFFKLFTPVGSRARDWLSRGASALAQTWAAVNTWFVDCFLPTRWDIRIAADINAQGQYLVCSNHQSWNDIVVLMKAFGRRAPFFKFFIKQELIWVPVLGLVWWGLDYPFMKRYTPSQIKKNPALKGKDMETTRKACERFRNQPGLVLNFLEGTRFTPAKRDRQSSPYRHLLRPKAGGFAFALGALGERLNSLLDVTIVYPEGSQGLWGLLSGQIGKVVVEVRQLTVPHEFYVGNYEADSDHRKRFQLWLGQLWTEKDARISAILAERT
ncbi:MAG: acyltransferase [Hydrocarboniphaga sp.]|uniref:acyltransferase n=1 Tax=Hydrocarboniphaga sp. TaxID=2033016 RepID=UPI0026046E0C|nr:acyltransferase [Hydrocarboniphaga sp.]MDB5969541.1 acyltransferase [Hydrocarboniphaga sp.]